MRMLKLKILVVWMVYGAPIAVAAATQDLSDGRQVLPRTLLPVHYELSLVPDAQALTFKGTVQIMGDAPTGGRQIVLNAEGLTFDEVRLDAHLAGTVTLEKKLGRAQITLPSTFAPGTHTLSIAYHGPITRETVGFFAMDYD